MRLLACVQALGGGSRATAMCRGLAAPHHQMLLLLLTVRDQ